MVMVVFLGTKEGWLAGEMGPQVDDDPTPPTVEPSRYTHRSIETLVVVLAVIIIVGVIAGIVARLCRSCIDGGAPAAVVPPPVEPKPPAAAEEAKK